MTETNDVDQTARQGRFIQLADQAASPDPAIRRAAGLQLLEAVLQHIEEMVVHHAATDLVNFSPESVITRTEINGWNQGSWREMDTYERDETGRCGTTMCLAGWTADLSGFTWLINDRYEPSVPGTDRAYADVEQIVVDDRIQNIILRRQECGQVIRTENVPLVGNDGRVETVRAYELAQAVLGLNRVEADGLFNGANTLSDLWSKYHAIRIADRIREQRRQAGKTA